MRVACVSYATEQGLGHLMRWFYQEGVVTDPLLVRHPRHPHHAEWYPPGTPVVDPRNVVASVGLDWFRGVGVCLFFETPFDWNLPVTLRSLGVRTVLVPMHEWYPESKLPASRYFDRVVSPSLLDADYFPGSAFVPVPVPRAVTWHRRDRALRYLHNAGHVGHREHKGTRQVLEALRHAEAPLTLTVRCQYEGTVRRMAEECGVYGDSRLYLEHGGVPYDELHAGHDVYVAPEKLNGLSLPLQEARAAGMLVITADRYPTNTWLGPPSALVQPASVSRVRVSPSCLPVDECEVDPRHLAAVMDRWYNRPLGEHSDAGRAWAEAHSWDVLKPRWVEAVTGGW